LTTLDSPACPTSAPAVPRVRHWIAAAAWPGAVFLLALLPRLAGLADRPLWLDEVFTWQRASLKPAALVLDSFQNHHMPSFFLLLSPLTGLGHPELWLRLPSAIFGALAVMLVFMIAYRIAGRLAGVLAALVMGLSPTALAFSQEARSYTLEMCLILVALYGMVRLALDLRAAGRGMLAPGARAGWLCFIGGTVAAVDTLGDGLPWLLAANLAFFCLLFFAPAPRALAINVVKADLIAALCAAPFYALMTHFQSSSAVNSVMWIPPLNLSRFWYSLGSVYFMHVADWVTFHFMKVPTPDILLWLIDAVLMAALAAATWRLRHRPAMLAVLGISLIFLPGLFALISLWRPIFLPRYLLWSAAPFAVLAGIGAAALLDHVALRARRVAVVLMAVLLLVNTLPYYGAETKPRWDIAARMLAQEVAPGDVVYLTDLGALPVLRLYLPPGAQTVVLNDADGDLAHAYSALSQGHRVWTVCGHAGQSADRVDVGQFFATNQALGTPSQVQKAGKRITIALYSPASPAPVANTQPAAPPAPVCAPGAAHGGCS